ncbi:MAG TPA: hypothetical protein VK550_15335 [Polyangiaceae bacterium]|nr:hypothetical protein [Polyangiaceae bacterium]
MLPHLLVAQLSAAIVVTRASDARDCPDTEHLAARVERISASPLSSPQNATTVVRADFSRAGSAYEAKLQLTGSREGERLLRDESPTCEPLADAVAVATAVLLDPASRPPPAREPHDQAPSWFAIWFSGRFGAGAGIVGGPSWVAGGGFETSLGPLTLIELGGALTGPQQSPLGAGTVEVRLWFAELGVFRSLTGETFKVGPTLHVMGGALHGEGTEYAVTSSASLTWLALGAGVRGDLAVAPRLRLGARWRLVVPLQNHSFSVGYVGTAYESEVVAGVADLVLDVRLW